MSIKTLHFIDNKYVPSVGGETFEVINPATEEVVATVAAAQPRDVDNAVRPSSVFVC
jgi:acyl-CoA reductase-like NAD-dependent aldehyde dehydrogenase